MAPEVPLPSPPTTVISAPSEGWVRRTWAIVGIVGGFLLYIVPGFFAIRSYRRWRAGTIRRPIFAWSCAWIGAAYVTVIVVGFLSFAYLSIPDELIRADFRDRAAPFDVGDYAIARFEHVDGTYRLTVEDTTGPITSVGELARTAYAVGIRADLEEVTEPGTTVGAMCLGPAAEGSTELAGYAFFAEPGGASSSGVSVRTARSTSSMKEGTRGSIRSSA